MRDFYIEKKEAQDLRIHIKILGVVCKEFTHSEMRRTEAQHFRLIVCFILEIYVPIVRNITMRYAFLNEFTQP